PTASSSPRCSAGPAVTGVGHRVPFQRRTLHPPGSALPGGRGGCVSVPRPGSLIRGDRRFRCRMAASFMAVGGQRRGRQPRRPPGTGPSAFLAFGTVEEKKKARRRTARRRPITEQPPPAGNVVVGPGDLGGKTK